MNEVRWRKCGAKSKAGGRRDRPSGGQPLRGSPAQLDKQYVVSSVAAEGYATPAGCWATLTCCSGWLWLIVLWSVLASAQACQTPWERGRLALHVLIVIYST